MARPQQVKILEECRVGPPPELHGSAGPKSLPLTFFDILWLRFPPQQRLFFYEISSQDDVALSYYDFIVPNLKRSLSLTLRHFLPLAGTLTWPQHSPKPILTYSDVNGDGVSLTVAESTSDFHRLSDATLFRRAADYLPLLPHLDVSDERAAAMALRITVFPSRGISVGVTTHHAVADGATSAMFTKLWARTCRAAEADAPTPALEMTPSYDRSAVKDPNGAEDAYLKGWLNQEGPNNRSLKAMEEEFRVHRNSVRGTFELSRDSIEKLKKSKGTHLSAFSVTCGYAWACLAKAMKIREKKMRLLFSADCRSRLNPKLPTTYFGNCVEGRSAVVETEELVGENGVRLAAEAIADAVKGLEEDGVIINGGLDTWISMSGKGEEIRTVAVGSSPRFKVYDTDFGWGRPRLVELISIERTGAIGLSDSRYGGGGIEIGLVMRMEDLEKFSSLFSQGLAVL